MKTCFVISPIGEPESSIRRHADQVLKHLIHPAVTAQGFGAPKRADHLTESGMITTQVIEQVTSAELVIADLTDANPNVFYELAVRHASRLPAVHIISAGQRIPFDVAGMRTVTYDLRDPDKLEEARQLLTEAVGDSVASEDALDNPLTTALDVISLRNSGDPEARSLGEIADEIGGIRSELRALASNTAIFEKLKAWEKLAKSVEKVAEFLDWNDSALRNIDGFYDLDDIMSKLDDIEGKLD